MTDPPRVRLHDVHIDGDVTDRDALLESIGRAIARVGTGEQTRGDTMALRDAIAADVTDEVSR